MQSETGTEITTGDSWYVLQTKRHRERVAHLHLQAAGIMSYLPRTIEWPRPAVGSPIGPLFPGYLFAQMGLTSGFLQALWTPGVKAFVSFGDVPATVDAHAIAFLRSREGPDGLIRSRRSEAPEGNEVRIVRGPFRGLTAVVEERLPARERVRVLLELLQRRTPVELPEQWIRLA